MTDLPPEQVTNILGRIRSAITNLHPSDAINGLAVVLVDTALNTILDADGNPVNPAKVRRLLQDMIGTLIDGSRESRPPN